MNGGRFELDTYIPRREWFTRQEDWAFKGTHGVGHITRVLVWAAGLHDIRRETDGGDRRHGERAAAWISASFRV